MKYLPTEVKMKILYIYPHPDDESFGPARAMSRQLKEKVSWQKRLAFHTITTEMAQQSPHFRLNSSIEDEIDCVFQVDPIDIEKNLEALDCYVTFRETIEKSGIKDFTREKEISFEIFRENYDPPLSDLFERITWP
jgi:hypothetical protein